MTISELILKYPRIYIPYKGNPGMINYLDLPDGWIPLVDRMLSHIQYNIEKNNWEPIHCMQQKEKYGSLRWYYEGGDERSAAIIDFVESLSYHVCMECGGEEDVKQSGGGWITTLCKTCRNGE